MVTGKLERRLAGVSPQRSSVDELFFSDRLDGNLAPNNLLVALELPNLGTSRNLIFHNEID
jgi:hypothetical protein